MNVFVSAGASLLPPHLRIDKDVFLEPKELAQFRHGDFIENKLSDSDYHLINADKTVRRISNSQSRWLLYSGEMTWKKTSLSNDYSPEKRGLFLGFGTSDADDNIIPVGFSEKDRKCYVNTAMKDMQPTIGLTLLNTSCASQLAQHLDIRGDNAFFSPHSDAGASALIEGFYSISQQKSKIALCGGASQKISEWFYLSYEHTLRRRNFFNLTEASSCILLHSDESKSSAKLDNVYRTVIHNQSQYRNFFRGFKHQYDDFFSIVHTGLGSINYDFLSQDENVLTDIPTFYFDKTYGYSGASSIFLAINYLIEKWNGYRADIDTTAPGISSQALIINHGLQGSCMAVVLNFNRVE